jgi:hypothetical protein
MSDSDQDNSDTLEIIDDFQEFTMSEDFREKIKKNKTLENKMLNLARQLLRATGTTEFSTTDNGYTGDEVIEQYKNNSVSVWKDEVAKKNHTKEITNDEISVKTDSYLARRMRYDKAREERMIESGRAPRKMIVDENTGISVFVNNQQQTLGGESSNDDEESDDEIFINKYLENIGAAKSTLIKKQLYFDSD